VVSPPCIVYVSTRIYLIIGLTDLAPWGCLFVCMSSANSSKTRPTHATLGQIGAYYNIKILHVCGASVSSQATCNACETHCTCYIYANTKRLLIYQKLKNIRLRDLYLNLFNYLTLKISRPCIILVNIYQWPLS
jgi:hypothetical protein